ncbi:hypothetical protein SRB5_20910 [Streptomyces sp. RB5]|uniref:HTH tetR-type domain-containing protein n=1 Tax=Streptomyces smaragdinus TaxID=2585196 RepID=A0A7K0CF28_9ACTN|nr:TetR/AcrR family transcriptional regulator [Streptomyces smaragdinus]MQY11963.1 hypothetical protein [Streptomyces smaragdinus]
MVAASERSRTAVVEAASRLLREQGVAAVTTRAVAQEAGVQPPAIYRWFGDKDGLLDGVAEYEMAAYVATKAQAPAVTDPIAGLRAGWEAHVGFALANPALFALFSDPDRARTSPAMDAGREVLGERVRRVAEQGRLAVSERRAVEMIQAAGSGAVLTLLALDPADRDPRLADAMYDAVARAILTDAPTLPADTPVGAAVTFRALIPELDALSDAERALMLEWLERAIAAGD